MIQPAYTLTANEVYSSLANLIISQTVFADNFGKHQTLVDKARVDGSLYGDRKLYYSCEALETHAFLGDQEAGNLLALDRAKDPKVQAIVLDVARQIRLTTSDYLDKRAWGDEYSFGSFIAVMLGMMTETKKIYEGTVYNVFIGNHVATRGSQNKTVSLNGTNDGQVIAEFLANLLVEMGDYSKDFNDYGMLRSYADSDIKVIWNSKYVNKITKYLTPTIFHKEGLVDKLGEITMPAKYFGRAVTDDDKGSGKVIGTGGIVDPTKGTVRAKVEKSFTFNGEKVHLFPGEALSAGMQVGGSGHPDFAEDEVYIEDGDVICKIVTELPPFMSAFEVGGSFFNPRSLTTNSYITFMHNTISALDGKPFITVKKSA